jgi:ankyrin repeat protein
MDEWAALRHAVRYSGNPEMTTMLLKGGADVSVRDKDGLTALMHATERYSDPSANTDADTGLKNILHELQEAVAETEGRHSHE